jgi:hypothetical protein
MCALSTGAGYQVHLGGQAVANATSRYLGPAHPGPFHCADPSRIPSRRRVRMPRPVATKTTA